jgi:hypothetical protein
MTLLLMAINYGSLPFPNSGWYIQEEKEIKDLPLEDLDKVMLLHHCVSIIFISNVNAGSTSGSTCQPLPNNTSCL